MKKLLIITAFGTLLGAYLINTRTQFLRYDKYVISMDFWIIWSVTCIFLTIYMFWITMVHYLYFIYNRDGTQGFSNDNSSRKGHYLIIAIVPIIVLHLSMLHVVFIQQGYTLLDSGYLYEGFFFFIVPVVLYTALVYYRPEWSIFYKMINKWVERLIRFILTYHRPKQKEQVVMVVPSAASADHDHKPVSLIPQPKGPAVPLMQLLFLQFKTRKSVFYTITGEEIATAHTSGILRDWPVKDWFVQIRKGFYVNMWYIWHSKRSKYQLIIDLHVQRQFMEGMQMEMAALEKMLHISKDLRKNIAHHFRNRDQLKKDGWDDVFYY